MKPEIPYYANSSGSHCVQACLRMGFEYFYPQTLWSIPELDCLSAHVPGQTTWLMRTYLETANLGYDVIIYDPVDYAALSKNPQAYMEEKFPDEYAEFNVQMSDMTGVMVDARALVNAHNLKLFPQSYTQETLRSLLRQGYLCITWVDQAKTNQLRDKFVPHVILVYRADDQGIYAHDPGMIDAESQMPNRFINWDLLERANKMNDQGETGEMMAFKPKFNPTKDVL